MVGLGGGGHARFKFVGRGHVNSDLCPAYRRFEPCPRESCQVWVAYYKDREGAGGRGVRNKRPAGDATCARHYHIHCLACKKIIIIRN